jgi:hypothetical protein
MFKIIPLFSKNPKIVSPKEKTKRERTIIIKNKNVCHKVFKKRKIKLGLSLRLQIQCIPVQTPRTPLQDAQTAPAAVMEIMLKRFEFLMSLRINSVVEKSPSGTIDNIKFCNFSTSPQGKLPIKVIVRARNGRAETIIKKDACAPNTLILSFEYDLTI